MKQITCFLLILAVILSASCVKNEETPGGTGEIGGAEIPAGFIWKTTQDVGLNVGMPSVSGGAPEYAVIRVYSSPMLSEKNIVAKGVVDAANATFRTAFTLPVAVDTIFVQTTLPDGTVSVRTAQVASQINLAGAAMKSSAVNSIGLAAPADGNTMPAYPEVAPKGEGDFAAEAIIRQTPSSNFQLGASWASHAAAAYYIPFGVVINGNIDLNGGFAPHKSPVLYVAGKLNLSWSNIGQAVLAILPGGEVTVSGTLTAQNIGNAKTPAIYIFKGGKLSAENMNLSCRYVVNNGEIVVDNLLDLNNSLVLYNTTDAVIQSSKFIYSNNGGLHNDGKIVTDDLQMNSSADFYNYVNGVLDFKKCVLEAGNTLVQQGAASIDCITVRGEFYVNCYTYVNSLIVDRGFVYLAADACLETVDSRCNNAQVELAPGSIFIADTYNSEPLPDSNWRGSNNRITNKDKEDVALILFREKVVSRQGETTQFAGPIEIVYDASNLAAQYQIGNYLSKGAYLTEKQLVNIPETACNGGKGEIESKPEPKPDYNDIEGAPYTYCFEDNWPWTGDYDMNDVVVKMSVDRRENNQGLVEFIKINWETLASGANSKLSLGIQLDKIPTTSVASLESTNAEFGEGAFAGAGLESGNEYAVIPLFNTVGEVLIKNSVYINTHKGLSEVATTRHTTTVVFTQPVNPATVLMSALNTFIVVNPKNAATLSRAVEVHLPGFAPTAFGDVSEKNSVRPDDPYRYYMKDNQKDNGMMWGLMIPGSFRYPCEGKDIREVYRYFKTWALSGGASHAEWYIEEADEPLVY